jgi:hypothetical protein
VWGNNQDSIEAKLMQGNQNWWKKHKNNEQTGNWYPVALKLPKAYARISDSVILQKSEPFF